MKFMYNATAAIVAMEIASIPAEARKIVFDQPKPKINIGTVRQTKIDVPQKQICGERQRARTLAKLAKKQAKES